MSKAVTQDQVKALEEMCLSIFAHARCDYEVTLSGNGVNACEASAVAWAVLDVLHGDGRAWNRAHHNEILAMAKELRIEAGEEDEYPDARPIQ